jgi:hypothetical protein
VDLALHLPTKEREYAAVGSFHTNVQVGCSAMRRAATCWHVAQRCNVLLQEFVQFLFDHTWIADSGLIVEYYSQKLICNTPEAQAQFILPDKKPLPSVLSFVQK